MWSKIKNIINQIIFRRKQVNFLVCGGQGSQKKKKKKKRKRAGRSAKFIIYYNINKCFLVLVIYITVDLKKSQLAKILLYYFFVFA